jgi:leucyl aminopeptidase (aminopeptidase T)
VICFAAMLVTTSVAQDPTRMADRIVTTADVQPGDLVVVFGGTHMVDLMEAVAIQANMAGGRTTMLLASDKVAEAYWKNVPIEHLGQKYAIADWIDEVDVWIGLPAQKDPSIFDGISEERFAIQQQSNKEWAAYLNGTKVAGVFVSYPSKEQAKRSGVDHETLLDMHWKALETDYNAISQRAAKLAVMLNSAASVRVTSPAGTDLTFKVGDRMVFKSDGMVTTDEKESGLIMGRFANLPDGQVFMAPVETSAEGKLVVPVTQCDGDDVSNISMQFDKGQMKDFKAESNASCITETLDPYDGPKDRFGYFSIGLNPAYEVIEDGGAHYRPGEAEGMVWVGVGGNDFIGGENKDTGGFGFPITRATVTIGDVTVVEDGKLVDAAF